MKQSIDLTIDELEKIIEIVKRLNPSDTAKLEAGRCTILSDTSSGIGTIVKVKVPVMMGTDYGYFTTTITDESNW